MHSKEELVAAAQAVAARRGTRALSLAEFRRESGIASKYLYRHFASWRMFCAAAGIESAPRKSLVRDPEIFAAMRDAFLACGGIVGREAFDPHFRYSHGVIRRRFSTWSNALAAFDRWVADHAPDFPYKDELARWIAQLPPSSSSPRGAAAPRWAAIRSGVCGAPVGYRAMMHAPTNELGVVFAFGLLADELGFVVDAISPAFPDCIAKRRVSATRWETVRIEFEYRSRNFYEHRHDVAGCDVIVCWEHDWTGCPLEVVELRAAIARLRGAAPR